MLLYTLTRGDLTRVDESCPSEGTSPGGCRRHEEQAATRSLQCCQEGWAGQAEVGTCSSWPSLAPMMTLQCSRCPYPRTLSIPHSPGLSLPAQPHAACIESGRKKNLGEKEKILYLCRGEVRSQISSSSAW